MLWASEKHLEKICIVIDSIKIKLNLKRQSFFDKSCRSDDDDPCFIHLTVKLNCGTDTITVNMSQLFPSINEVYANVCPAVSSETAKLSVPGGESQRGQGTKPVIFIESGRICTLKQFERIS